MGSVRCEQTTIAYEYNAHRNLIAFLIVQLQTMCGLAPLRVVPRGINGTP